MTKTRTNSTKRATPKSAHPIFDAMIAEARNAPPEELIGAADLDRRRPLTPDEIAAADAWLDDLEREDAVSIAPATGGEAPVAASVDGTDRRHHASGAHSEVPRRT